MHILHIEDDVSIQKAVARTLALKLKADVTTVANPTDAIAILKAIKFDIVVSDYNIDGGTGGEVLEWLRANQPDQRFMFLSSDEDRIVGFNVPYMVKPAPMSDVCRMIEDVIK